MQAFNNDMQSLPFILYYYYILPIFICSYTCTVQYIYTVVKTRETGHE